MLCTITIKHVTLCLQFEVCLRFQVWGLGKLLTSSFSVGLILTFVYSILFFSLFFYLHFLVTFLNFHIFLHFSLILLLLPACAVLHCFWSSDVSHTQLVQTWQRRSVSRISLSLSLSTLEICIELPVSNTQCCIWIISVTIAKWGLTFLNNSSARPPTEHRLFWCWGCASGVSPSAP